MQNLTVRVAPVTSWKLVDHCAKMTMGKDVEGSDDIEVVKRHINRQHSPIRAKIYSIDILNVKYWVAMHLVRHKVGVEFFVSTQRDDRGNNPKDRDDAKQGNLVNMTMVINLQALINMAERRLCTQAHKDTRAVMRLIVEELRKVDTLAAKALLPYCGTHGGVCHEDKPCGCCEAFKKLSL